MTHPEPDDRGSTGVAGLLVAFSVLVLGLSLVSGTMIGTSTGMQGNDEYEPNDDFDTAANITATFSAENLRTSNGDHDFYAVELQEGDRVNVSVEFTNAEGDVDLVVYDPNRDQIERTFSTADGEDVSFRARTSGTYYVRIFGWTEDVTDYSLSIDRSTETLQSNDAFEYNDGFSSATVIEAPFDAEELLITASDRDVFAIEVPAETRLNVSILFVHDEADLDLLIYDSNRELVTIAASYTDNESISFRNFEADTFYVEVSSNDTSSTPYSMSVRTSPATPIRTTNDTPTTATTTSQSTTTSATSGTTTETPATQTETPGFTGLLSVLGIAGALVVRRLLGSSSDEGRDSK